MFDRVKLLGLDLDGTLLNNKKQLAIVDEKCIRRAMAKGIIVVPITGRPKSGITDCVNKLFQNSYIITSNGAVTTDVRRQKDIESICIQKSAVEAIADLIKDFGEEIQMEIFLDGIGYVQHNHLQAIKEKYSGTSLEAYISKSRMAVSNIHSFIFDSKDNIAGISIMTKSVVTRKKIQTALLKFEDIKITSSVSTDLEINSIGAGKGQALVNLAKRLGIKDAEIMACGDSGNDIEMLQMAGIGIAMGNADEKVKKVANYVTRSNEENGVAYAIERFILNR